MRIPIARRVRKFFAYRRLCRKLVARYGRLAVYTEAQVATAARMAKAHIVKKQALLILTNAATPAAEVTRNEFADRYLGGRERFDARDVTLVFAPRAFPRFDFPNYPSRYTSAPRF